MDTYIYLKWNNFFGTDYQFAGITKFSFEQQYSGGKKGETFITPIRTQKKTQCM